MYGRSFSKWLATFGASDERERSEGSDVRKTGGHMDRGKIKKQTGPRTVYDGRDEVPWKELKYADGTVRYYGSGRVVFDTSDGSIRVVLRWHWVSGVVRWVLPREVREGFHMAIKRLVQDIETVSARGVSVPEATDYPLMLEYLTHSKYDDGSPRQTSVLIVTNTGDAWRVCLTDKDQQRVMWKQGATLLDAIQAIELALMGDDPAEWRRSAEATPGRKKRG